MRLLEKCGRCAVSKESSFREQFERQEREKADAQSAGAFAKAKFLLSMVDIRQPVQLARLFTRFGLSLRKAHSVLNRLVQGEKVAVELSGEPQVISLELRRAGLNENLIQMPNVDPRQIRQRFGITQAEFASRFCLELDTVQNWEQGRYALDRASVLLLAVIAQSPAVVDAVLAGNAEPQPTTMQNSTLNLGISQVGSNSYATIIANTIYGGITNYGEITNEYLRLIPDAMPSVALTNMVTDLPIKPYVSNLVQLIAMHSNHGLQVVDEKARSDNQRLRNERHTLERERAQLEQENLELKRQLSKRFERLGGETYIAHQRAPSVQMSDYIQ
jgi:DNA-binding transcriptional regulator YiaG